MLPYVILTLLHITMGKNNDNKCKQHISAVPKLGSTIPRGPQKASEVLISF